MKRRPMTTVPATYPAEKYKDVASAGAAFSEAVSELLKSTKSGDLKQAILEKVRREDHVTFAELESIEGFAGEHELTMRAKTWCCGPTCPPRLSTASTS